MVKGHTYKLTSILRFFSCSSSSKSSKFDVSAICLTCTGIAAGRSLLKKTTPTFIIIQRTHPLYTHRMCSQSVPLKNECLLTSLKSDPSLSTGSLRNLIK